MPAKTCLVLHKKSCTKPEVKAAVKHVRESGIDVDVYIPWSRKDLRRFVRQAIEDGAERIVAGGGDGTLNAVVNALIRGDIRPKASLGILPLGTANDFAKGAGIDTKDLISALELACTGSPTKVDVGRMNDQYFINVASAGFGAEEQLPAQLQPSRIEARFSQAFSSFWKPYRAYPPVRA
jgi:YegS/Rv2252/BmrU family lipid kinase